MISLAHHWLVTYRGGEKVVAEFRRLFPSAPMSTLVVCRGAIPDWIVGEEVYTSWIQHLPGASRRYKALLPLHPSAFGRLSVSSRTRLILSSDAAMVKGLRVPHNVPHVCYCHSPPRYLWDMPQEYLNNSGLGLFARAIFRLTVPYARRFDYRGAQRVGAFIANSNFVAERIRRIYGKPSAVIPPPVEVGGFEPRPVTADFYLIVSQLVPYKRVDIAVEAFNRLGKRLVVIGEGSEMPRLRRMAEPNISFLGRQPFQSIKEHMETCRAFLYPQIEDFGITAVEAQAAGRPVIAYRAGGACESVVEGQTGMFFESQTAESLSDAVIEFERHPQKYYSSDQCRKNAERFSPLRFRREVMQFLCASYPELMADTQLASQ